MNKSGVGTLTVDTTNAEGMKKNIQKKVFFEDGLVKDVARWTGHMEESKTRSSVRVPNSVWVPVTKKLETHKRWNIPKTTHH